MSCKSGAALAIADPSDLILKAPALGDREGILTAFAVQRFNECCSPLRKAELLLLSARGAGERRETEILSFTLLPALALFSLAESSGSVL